MPPDKSARDSPAELKSRVEMAFETMKKKAAIDVDSASRNNSPLPPSITVKTVHFGEVEEIEYRDEIRYIEDETESLSEVEDTDASPEIPLAQISTSIRTQKKLTFTNNFVTTPLCQSDASNDTSSLSTDSTRSSTSDDFFSLECPVALSLSYSDSEQGLEVVIMDAMLSMSSSFSYNGTIEDEDTVVALNGKKHDKLGCLVVMKNLADNFTLAARKVRSFYNSPRKSVTFNLSDTEICYMSVQNVE